MKKKPNDVAGVLLLVAMVLVLLATQSDLVRDIALALLP